MFAFVLFFATLANRINNVKRGDRGATAVEYGLMVSLIAVAIIATVTLLGAQLVAIFDAVTASL